MKLNKIFCGTSVKNTGLCDCFLDPKLIVGATLVPVDRVFTQEELEDLLIAQTFNDLILDIPARRGYPFAAFNGITDSTEEPTVFTSGYGEPEPVREGSNNWIFNFRKGGITLSNALRSFNGLTSKYAAIFFDSTNLIIGTTKKDIDGNDGLAGIPLTTLYTYPWKPADGSNPAQYRTQFVFRPEFVNELVAFGKIDPTVLQMSNLAGLETVKLLDTSFSGTAGVIGATTDCGSTELYDLYGDLIADVDAWTGIAAVGGAIVAPTAVVKAPSSKGWSVTFAAAVSAVSLVTPTQLAALDVVGYESTTLLAPFV